MSGRPDRDDAVGGFTGVAPPPASAKTLIESLDELAGHAGSTAAREIQETQDLLAAAAERGLIAPGVRQLNPKDTAEAFVGSVIFGAPLLVEEGVFDIADHLLGTRVFGVPVFLAANVAFVVLMTYALLEWTGRHQEESHTVLGIPVRVVMILLVSFVVSALLMTVWGRLGGWQSPTAALSRITVLWTVGSLGAALGDLLSERGPGADALVVGADGVRPTAAEEIASLSDDHLLASLDEQFETLESTIEDSRERQTVEELRAWTERSAFTPLLGQRIRKYTSRDIAEAFVGSVFFSIPFLVEDGVFSVATFFLSLRVGAVPVFLLLNAGFVLLMVGALVYWAGPQDVQVSRPLFGVIPRRLVGVSVVSFCTALALMTMWGRVDGWQDPAVAIARISVVWTLASFGAALGDILPGESSGSDIYDELAELGDRVT